MMEALVSLAAENAQSNSLKSAVPGPLLGQHLSALVSTGDSRRRSAMRCAHKRLLAWLPGAPELLVRREDENLCMLIAPSATGRARSALRHAIARRRDVRRGFRLIIFNQC